MIITFRNYLYTDKYTLELSDWQVTNFSMGPRVRNAWYRQVLSVNGELLKPKDDKAWHIPRLTLAEVINDNLYARFEEVDDMIKILFRNLRDHIYPFPDFYSKPGDWDDAKKKCDAVLRYADKLEKLKAFI